MDSIRLNRLKAFESNQALQPREAQRQRSQAKKEESQAPFKSQNDNKEASKQQQTEEKT